jgi:hypothetical protein
MHPLLRPNIITATLFVNITLETTALPQGQQDKHGLASCRKIQGMA